MSQKQRLAAEIEAKIKTKVDSGEFMFNFSYIMDGGYFSTKGVKCRGCAISACAFALGGVDAISMNESDSIPRYDPRVTINDIAQLEMGFEGWKYWKAHDGRKLFPTTRAAFYKLGQKLRAEHPEYSGLSILNTASP